LQLQWKHHKLEFAADLSWNLKHNSESTNDDYNFQQLPNYSRNFSQNQPNSSNKMQMKPRKLSKKFPDTSARVIASKLAQIK